MMAVMEGRGCQARGEGGWSAEMTTWTMSGDKRSGETTGADLSVINTGGKRNNSAFDVCFLTNTNKILQILNKMVKFICIYFIWRKFLVLVQG